MVNAGTNIICVYNDLCPKYGKGAGNKRGALNEVRLYTIVVTCRGYTMQGRIQDFRKGRGGGC